MVRELPKDSISVVMALSLSIVKHLLAQLAVRVNAERQCFALDVLPDPERPMKATD